MSQSRPVLSSETVTTVLPSGLIHIAFIPSVCSVKVFKWCASFFFFLLHAEGVSLCFFEIPLPIIVSKLIGYYSPCWWTTVEINSCSVAIMLCLLGHRTEWETFHSLGHVRAPAGKAIWVSNPQIWNQNPGRPSAPHTVLSSETCRTRVAVGEHALKTRQTLLHCRLCDVSQVTGICNELETM